MNFGKLAVSVALMGAVGCNDELALPDEVGERCSLDTPWLLLAEEEAWQLDAPVPHFAYHVVGDRLLHEVGPYPARDWYLSDLCDGEAERVLRGDQGLYGGFVLAGPSGPTLFAEGKDGLYAADRLDVPGADAPRRIEGYPTPSDTPGLLVVEERGSQPGMFLTRLEEPLGEPAHGGIAGVGAPRKTLWYFSGDPGDAVKPIATNTVSYHRRPGPPDRLLALSDSGDARWIDLETFAEEPIRGGVRWLSLIFVDERVQFLLQEIGDGVSERVVMRDPTTGAEQQVLQNKYAATALGDDPEQTLAGHVVPGPAIALIGPGGALVEAHDVVTLAPIEIPEHARYAPSFASPYFDLVLADPNDHVRALWDPSTGSVMEWFRGDEAALTSSMLEWHDGMIWIYEDNPDGSQKLSEIDPVGGARRVLLARLGHTLGWSGEQVVHAFEVDDDGSRQVVLSDLTTGSSEVLLDRALHATADIPGARLFYLDREAETPGLWVRPLALR